MEPAITHTRPFATAWQSGTPLAAVLSGLQLVMLVIPFTQLPSRSWVLPGGSVKRRGPARPPPTGNARRVRHTPEHTPGGLGCRRTTVICHGGFGARDFLQSHVTIDPGQTEPAPDEDETQHLTLAEAAEMTGLSPTLLERWAEEGRLPSRLRADGTRIFVRRDVLSRWVRMGDVSGGEA